MDNEQEAKTIEGNSTPAVAVLPRPLPVVVNQVSAVDAEVKPSETGKDESLKEHAEWKKNYGFSGFRKPKEGN